MNKEDFCKELKELSLKYGVLLPSEMRLTILDETMHKKETIHYEICSEMNYPDGTKNTFGPFLKSSMEMNEKETHSFDNKFSNFSIGDPHKLYPNKSVPTEWKELVNYTAASNPKSTIRKY